jgi:nucleoporin NUP2
MRALNAIVSFISPFQSARRSAAFGVPDEEDATFQEEAEEEDSVAKQLYPALPSSPAGLLSSSVYGDDPEEILSGPEVGPESAVDATTIMDEDVPSSSTSVMASPRADVVPIEIADDGSDSNIDLPRIEEPDSPPYERSSPSLNSRDNDAASVDQSQARVPVQTDALTFKAFADDGSDAFASVARSYREESHPQSASRFTFGLSERDALPRYPTLSRPSRPVRNISPLAKNYDLLSRFFAEKAEQEARLADGTPSIMSMDGEGDGTGGLTQVEVAGCMRLIEQSYAHGHGTEIESLRREALARGRVNGGDSPHVFGASDERSADYPAEHQSFLSRSPSLPLGATATASPVLQGQNLYGIRPSTSFLAPSVKRSHEDAMVTQSLTTAFRTASNAPTQRRHRPLYLGPGMGAKSSATLRRQQQQAFSRKSALSAVRMNQQNFPAKLTTEGSTLQDERPEATTKRRRLPGDRDDAPALFVPQQQQSASAKPVPVKQTNDVQIARPQQLSQTADAMLSILRSGPSIPLRTSAMLRSKELQKDKPEVSNPDVINPYERETRLSRRSRASTSNSALAAKEKERLREEREKRQKAMKEREARKESTLEFLQRTAPPSTRTRMGARNVGRRIAFDEEDASEGETEGEGEEDNTGQDAASASAPIEKGAKASKESVETQGAILPKVTGADDERRRKNEELRRRTEQLLAKAKATKEATQDVAQSLSSSSSQIKPPPFNTAFAPKKPSPLSQAVPDSPSGSSEASDRDSAKFAFSPAKFPPPVTAKESIVLSDDDDTAPAEDATALQSTRSKIVFPSASSHGLQSGSTSLPKQTTPTSASAPVVPKPAPTAPAPAPSHGISSVLPPEERALSEAPSSLPKFDFALEVVFPASATLATTGEEDRKAALTLATSALPAFDFIGTEEGRSKALPATAQSPTSANKPAFSFKAVPTGSPPKANGTGAASEQLNTAATSSNASDKAVSALLSGSGEGEEDEESEHEVRCKVWNLSDGKWNDLGIGMLRIKKHKTSGKNRILVRNEGNGKVTVNFNLISSFKANVDKTIVTFVGFDQAGKPTNFRVKIKTEAGANDLKAALDKSVAAIQ